MKNELIILLSGESSTIPEAEARALVLTYDPNAKIEREEPRVIKAITTANLKSVSWRIAYARRVGISVSSYTRAELKDVIKGKRGRIRIFNLMDRKDNDIKKELAELIEKVDLVNPDFELTVIMGKERYIIISIPSAMQQGWSIRRPRLRPFFHPSAIFPKLSRALVNLSRVREGDTLLDPFSGTGSIAIEASIVGLNVIASDISKRMVKGALENMRYMKQEWLGLFLADSCYIPLRTIDTIVTDLPYGRASSTFGREVTQIVQSFLEEACRLLKSGARLVVMHPNTIALNHYSFNIEEEHEIYVHKNLTRRISILRRN